MIEQWTAHIGLLGLPLGILSIIGLALIIERSWFFIRMPLTADSSVLQALLATLEQHKKKPKAIRDELTQHLLMTSSAQYYRGVRFLRLIAVISPMLGLLGTVLGIIDAFQVISLHDGPVYPALIADGLWTAMITTAVGLIIALPSLFAAFIFARLAEQRLLRYQTILNETSLSYEGITL